MEVHRPLPKSGVEQIGQVEFSKYYHHANFDTDRVQENVYVKVLETAGQNTLEDQTVTIWFHCHIFHASQKVSFLKIISAIRVLSLGIVA